MVKIEVDKDFLDRVLSEQTKIKKQIKELTDSQVLLERRIGRGIGSFPVVIKGTMEHQHISVSRQKEFFKALEKLMVVYKIKEVKVKLDLVL